MNTGNLFKDKMLVTGLVLILASFCIFALTQKLENDSVGGVFFVNYVIAAGYLIAVFVYAVSLPKMPLSKGKLAYTLLMLILFFISAFALNREMNVFDRSVTWLCAWLIVSCIALIAAIFHQFFSPVWKQILFFFLGMAFVLFVYYAVYLLPLYGISVIGLLAVGISVHTYIPGLLALVTFVIIRRACIENRRLYYAAGAGVLLPLLIAVVYTVCWKNLNNKINLLLNKNILNEGKLPAWVVVSQHIDKDYLTEHLIKAGLVYKEGNLNGNPFSGGLPSHSFDAPKEHDPLVVIATLFCKRTNLDETDRIKILASMYDSRQHAQERLWAGDNLETISVISNVKLFPEYRMAYTEKTLTIQNHAKNSWNREEAIYTFHLPEGAVVSSLSLWIDGREVPSRLSTRSKADSAYKEIVGVENRDPSVVHWQEGNTITARIFPCTWQENRKFRIGITSPLQKDGRRLVYQNIYFEGPAAANATETLQVAFSNKPAGLILPDGFTKSAINTFQADRTYQPNWTISCTAPPLAATGFSFNHAGYQVSNYEPAYEPFSPENVYLDVNSAWSKQEFLQVWNKVKSHPVYVHLDHLTKLSPDNLDDAFTLLSAQNFSLFPVYSINDPAHSLIVSKSAGITPNLHDLDGSVFGDRTKERLAASNGQIRLYNIGDELNPYLKSLKELRVFNYDAGSVNSLVKLLDQKKFIKVQEDDNHIFIGSAKLVIQKTDSLSTGNAPDHLLRLFAYNDLMKKVGVNYFSQNFVRPDILAEADQAYIVSPVSSLIVLETQEDNKRFGIDQNKNSLGNASMRSSGAVPEPKEWLLILLCVSVFVYVVYLSNFTKEEI
jgi:XrtN system VIT domain protein